MLSAFSSASVYEFSSIAETDPGVGGRVYGLVLNVYSDHIDPQAGTVGSASEYIVYSDPQRDAWEYLACQKSEQCNLSEFVALFDQHFKTFQRQEMIDRAKACKKASVMLNGKNLVSSGDLAACEKLNCAGKNFLFSG